MRRSKPRESDELRSEYDFAKMAGGVRGRYVRRYRAGTNLALLERDVAAAFPTDEAVNDALRAVLRAASRIPRTVRLSNKRLQPPGRKMARG